MPDFSAMKSPTLAEFASLQKPIFAVPVEDAENPIIAVFFGALSQDIVEVSVVFSDEDHPLSLIDVLYDSYRWNFAWKREADVESFHLCFPKGHRAGTSPSSISFPTTFAGVQRFDETLVTHFSAELPYDEFHKEDQRPVIYVQTWNHLYSNRSGGGVSNWKMISDYRELRGTRQDVEKLFRR
ncbi:MAG: hypothetical protein P1V97_31665 [Planctomycetota bacterium]|nr:hypothetical protein [Planctomycetota bacterium]